MALVLSLGLFLALASGCGEKGPGGPDGSKVDLGAATQKLKSEDPAVRADACADIALVGEKAVGMVKPLIELLEDKDPTVRRNAAYALMMIGPKAAEAIPAVKKLLQDSEQPVMMQAVNTLRALDPGAKDFKVMNVSSPQ